ncbi:MAG: hypothetical protein JJU45_09575 [Acidimicrobiia bacterium]|nr:hypothetical protein [Acidimicrobiia bacterium]
MAGRAAFPGSFNPLTVAHLTIADAARRHLDVTVVHLVLSEVTLGKEHHPDLPPVNERADRLERATRRHAWLEVVVTPHQLLADIADGYDAVVLGADKLAQVHDPRFYDGDPARRDAALARLPRMAVAPRPPHPVPPELRLAVPPWVAEVSATAVRAGRSEWAADPMRRSGLSD